MSIGEHPTNLEFWLICTDFIFENDTQLKITEKINLKNFLFWITRYQERHLEVRIKQKMAVKHVFYPLNSLKRIKNTQ